MQIIVISSTTKFDTEIHQVNAMFDAGLECFHLRKPKFSKQQLKDYIELITPKYRKHIVLHTHYRLALKYNLKGIHLSRRYRRRKYMTWWMLKKLKWNKPDISVSTSFHSLLSLLEEKRKYNYVMISPVFNSISKRGYGAAFSHDTLKATLKRSPYDVIALGGVDADKIDTIQELGFSGMALLGALWASDREAVEVFKEIKAITEGKPALTRKIDINPVKITL